MSQETEDTNGDYNQKDKRTEPIIERQKVMRMRIKSVKSVKKKNMKRKRSLEAMRTMKMAATATCQWKK
eukprot:3997255-Ditylum_brightwellii.AAC.2